MDPKKTTKGIPVEMFNELPNPSVAEPSLNNLPRFEAVLGSQLRCLSPFAVGRSRAAASDAEPVDLDRLQEMVDHDPSQMREIVRMYMTESNRVLRDLGASVQAGDWAETSRLAHRLGGTSATCGMIAPVHALRDLEMTAGEGRWSKNQALFLEATRQQARVSAALEGYGLWAA